MSEFAANEIVIGPASVTANGPATRLSCRVEYPSHLSDSLSLPNSLWIEWEGSDTPIDAKIDPFVIALLPVCGKLSCDLRTEQAISQKLLHNLYESTAIQANQYAGLFRIPKLKIRGEKRSLEKDTTIASFFSGGVDSIYNIVEFESRSASHGCDKISYLWAVHGLDIPLANKSLWEKTVIGLEKSADRIEGAKLLFARTNIRDHYEKTVEWLDLGFGPALAAISNSAASLAGRVLIASATTYRKLYAHASTPMLDQFWSSDEQDIVHFSARVNRMQKIETIARNRPDLLSDLRVCWTNPDDLYNCGRCEKCIRTMTALSLCNALKSAHSFPSGELEPLLKKLSLGSKTGVNLDIWEDIYKYAKSTSNSSLTEVIGQAIKRGKRARRISLGKRAIAKQLRGLGLLK